MKRTLFFAVLALGSLTTLATFAQAPAPQTSQAQQEHHHGGHNPHKTAMRMSKELNLSADQTAKLEPILAQRQNQAMAIRNNTTLRPDQQRVQMRDLNRNMRQQLAAVLTPEQMQQWKAMRKEHHHEQESSAPTGA